MSEEMSQEMTLDQILADLKGFGIVDTEEIITLTVGEKTIRLRISNVPTDAELQALLAAEEYRGHAWITRVRAEMLSRAISWINGVDIKKEENQWVVDPYSGNEKLVQVVLRDMIMGWGQEAVQAFWKILMVHCQRIEDKILDSLPDSAIMTDIEKRFVSRAVEEIEELNRAVLKDTLSENAAEEAKE